MHMEVKNRIKLIFIEKQRTNNLSAKQLGKAENTVSRR